MAKAVVVHEYEQGLDYRKGKFAGVLGSGQYKVWAFTGREIRVVDMRQTALQVTGQEVLTADQASVRLNLLAQTREALGDSPGAAILRATRFRLQPDPWTLGTWLDTLPADQRPPVHETVRQVAGGLPDPIASARLLAVIEDWAGIERIFVDCRGNIDGRAYGCLAPMADGLAAASYPLGATLAYRALLESILDEARSTACGHAADYWFKLCQLALEPLDLGALETPAEFAARISLRHKRKPAFWARVAQART